MTPTERLEQLKKPPIAEVVCGFVFQAVKLDPISLGGYWATKRDSFPRYEIHPPIEDRLPLAQPEAGPPTILLSAGYPPLRTWFFSADDVLVLQAQQDRFYVNWRRTKGKDYPRFSDRPGEPGLLGRALMEFGSFAAFCRDSIGTEPLPFRVELAKVDHFIQGRDWTDNADLAAMLPLLKPVVSLSKADEPVVGVQLSEPRQGGQLFVSVDSGQQGGRRLLKLETRLVAETGATADELRRSFQRANDELNTVFGELVPKSERDRRFQRDGGN